MSFPEERLRRYRQSETWRHMLQETTIEPQHLIMPIFVHEGLSEPQEISGMEGIYQLPLSHVLTEVEELNDLGIKSCLLFGIPKHKDEQGSEADNESGIVQQAVRLIKEQHPEMIVIADCCLCEYTSTGQCGVSNGDDIDNDQTLKRLQSIALSYAKAGVDCIAPSGMMDGMIQAIRGTCDENGYTDVSIMSYAVKYASAFYGPFREAAGFKEHFKADRRTHQLSPSQREEGIREAVTDDEEGADFIIIKPGLPYLDMIRECKEKTHKPIVAYQVSGEYAMIKAASKAGVMSESEAVNEVLLSFRRAGAQLIISYYAKDVAKGLQ